MIRDKMRALEPSEKAIIERLIREERENNMTEEQKEDREKGIQYEKEKKESDQKREKEMRQRMIEMAIESKEKEIEEKMSGEQLKRAVSLRKAYDKEIGKVITVEYHSDQPINKVLPTKVIIQDPNNPDEEIEVETIEKVPYYEVRGNKARSEGWEERSDGRLLLQHNN